MNILWSNEMNLAISLITEVDEEQFVKDVITDHLSLTGEEIYLKDWLYSKDDLIHKLEII